MSAFSGRVGRGHPPHHRPVIAIQRSSAQRRRNRQCDCRRIASSRSTTCSTGDQPHTMRRYTALAFDNIRRDPAHILPASCTARLGCSSSKAAMIRIRPTSFPAAAASIERPLSCRCPAGRWHCRASGLRWRPRLRNRVAALLIAYIPATLAFVLTNMRYSDHRPAACVHVRLGHDCHGAERSGQWLPHDREDATATRIAKIFKQHVGLDRIGVAQRVPARVGHLRWAHVPERLVDADDRRVSRKNASCKASFSAAEPPSMKIVLLARTCEG